MKIGQKYIIIIILILVAALTLGCSLLSGLPIPGLNQAGNGSFSDPAAGLKDLKSFHATFQQDVIGTLDGKPYEKHTTLEIGRTAGQVDFSRTLAGTEDTASYFHLITSGQAVYRWYALDQGCQGEAGQPADGEMLEPALLLPALNGATKVGSETVNQVPAVHYTFTQADMKLADPKPEANGEIWIAENGGFVVKYRLSIKPVSNPGKEKVQASQEWSYEVSRVNALEPIQLPEECLPVPLDIPTMQDAREVNRSSGLLSYVTDSTAEQVVGLYSKALPGMGWTTKDTPPSGELKLPYVMSFNNGADGLSVNIDKSDQAGLDVDVYLYRFPQKAGSSTHATETPGATQPKKPAATVNPALSGLPDDIPLYPGVTDMINMGTSIRVISTDTVDAIGNFYKEKMPTLGWTLFNEQKSNDAEILIWQKEERTISIMVSPSNGVSFIAIAQQ